MLKRVVSFLLAGMFGVLLTAVGASAAAFPPVTIKGKVLLPDGGAAAGVKLALFPFTGEAVDKDNTRWKIPNYDFHRVTTDSAGRFEMTGVTDYPENALHHYVIFAEEPKFYHGVMHVVIGHGYPLEQNVEVQLLRATVLRIKLKDKHGQPYNGKRAVYIQSGVLGQGVVNGISYVTEVEFVNGVGVHGPVVIKDKKEFRGRVAILDFPNSRFAHEAMKEHKMARGDSDEPLRWAMRSLRGKSLDHAPRLVTGGYTDVEFSLQ